MEIKCFFKSFMLQVVWLKGANKFINCSWKTCHNAFWSLCKYFIELLREIAELMEAGLEIIEAKRKEQQ